MKNKQMIYIFLVFVVLVALLSFSSWSNSYAIKDIDKSSSNALIQSMTLISPLLIGFLIVILALLILVVWGKVS